MRVGSRRPQPRGAPPAHAYAHEDGEAAEAHQPPHGKVLGYGVVAGRVVGRRLGRGCRGRQVSRRGQRGLSSSTVWQAGGARPLEWRSGPTTSTPRPRTIVAEAAEQVGHVGQRQRCQAAVDACEGGAVWQRSGWLTAWRRRRRVAGYGAGPRPAPAGSAGWCPQRRRTASPHPHGAPRPSPASTMMARKGGNSAVTCAVWLAMAGGVGRGGGGRMVWSRQRVGGRTMSGQLRSCVHAIAPH